MVNIYVQITVTDPTTQEIPLSYFDSINQSKPILRFKKIKLHIRETPTLSTDADSRTNKI